MVLSTKLATDTKSLIVVNYDKLVRCWISGLMFGTLFYYTHAIFFTFSFQKQNTDFSPILQMYTPPTPAIIFKGQVPDTYFVDYAWPPPEKRRWIYSMTS